MQLTADDSLRVSLMPKGERAEYLRRRQRTADDLAHDAARRERQRATLQQLRDEAEELSRFP
jgi:hypothetical protein